MLQKWNGDRGARGRKSSNALSCKGSEMDGHGLPTTTTTRSEMDVTTMYRRILKIRSIWMISRIVISSRIRPTYIYRRILRLRRRQTIATPTSTRHRELYHIVCLLQSKWTVLTIAWLQSFHRKRDCQAAFWIVIDSFSCCAENPIG